MSSEEKDGELEERCHLVEPNSIMIFHILFLRHIPIIFFYSITFPFTANCQTPWRPQVLGGPRFLLCNFYFSLEECLSRHYCLAGNLATTMECLSASGPCRLSDHLRSSSQLSRCLLEASGDQETNDFVISNIPSYTKCMKVIHDKKDKNTHSSV